LIRSKYAHHAIKAYQREMASLFPPFR